MLQNFFPILLLILISSPADAFEVKIKANQVATLISALEEIIIIPESKFGPLIKFPSDPEKWPVFVELEARYLQYFDQYKNLTENPQNVLKIKFYAKLFQSLSTTHQTSQNFKQKKEELKKLLNNGAANVPEIFVHIQ